MTWDASARRVSPTAPFDAAQTLQTTTRLQPDQTGRTGSAGADAAFGTDGATTRTLSGMSGGGAAVDPRVLSAFGAPAQADDAVTTAVQGAEGLIGKHQQTLQVSRTSRQQAAPDQVGTTFSARIATLQQNTTRLNAGITELNRQLKSLKQLAVSVPADDPRAAQLSATITQVKQGLTGLKAERQRTATALSGVRNEQAAAQSRQRTNALNTVGQLLDTGRTPQDQAAMLDMTARQLGQQGASQATVTLLRDMARALRGDGVYRGQVTGGLQQALKALGNGAGVQAERQALSNLVARVTPNLLTHARLNLGAIPRAAYFRAASDADGVQRNATITQRYRQFETVAQEYLGPPAVNTWFYMAQNASSEVGKALDDKTGCVLESPWAAVKAAFTHLPTAISGKFDDALKAGNREIYNTIAPAAEIFFRAEAAGQDGVEALLASDHFREGLQHNAQHPTYADTDKLVEAFRFLQRARRCGNEEERAGLISRFNKNIADFEQRQVLQPILDADPDVRSYLRTVSSGLSWTRPDGQREALLPNGGDWGNVDTRLKAIAHVSDVSVAHQIYLRTRKQLTTTTQPQRPVQVGTLPRRTPTLTPLLSRGPAVHTSESTRPGNTARLQAQTAAMLDERARSQAMATVRNGERRVSR